MVEKMHKRKTIAVIGGGKTYDYPKRAKAMAHQLGRALAEQKFDVVTGAGSGLPEEVAIGARRHGGRVYGVSGDSEAHSYVTYAYYGGYEAWGMDGIREDEEDEVMVMVPKNKKAKLGRGLEKDEIYDHITYTGLGDTGRSVPLVAGADAAIVIGGAEGTLVEFAVAVKEGKKIGVLERTGGLADQVRKLEAHRLKKILKGSTIIYSKSPRELVKELRDEFDGKRKTAVAVTVTETKHEETSATVAGGAEKPAEIAQQKLDATSIIPLVKVTRKEVETTAEEAASPNAYAPGLVELGAVARKKNVIAE